MREKRKLVYGWGINDVDYSVYTYLDGKIVNICPVYVDWKEMLRRVFSEKYLSKYPSYREVTICEEWKYFSKFKDWVLNIQPNKDFKNCQLDKDLLSENIKCYSPETCVYLCNKANSFITDTRPENSRDSDIKGFSVDKKTGKFRVQCSNPFGEGSNRVGYIGLFSDKVEAHSIWLKQKKLYAKMLAELQVDIRVANFLLNMY